MGTPLKEANERHAAPTSALRKQPAAPATDSPTKKLQKRRMSAKNMRRKSVSWRDEAPKDEAAPEAGGLTEVFHFVPQEDHNGQPSPLDDGPGSPVHQMAWGPYAAPEAEAEASPGQVDMDITLPVPRHAAQDLTHQGFFAPGDVTAAVPSLGDLARADEEGAAEEQEEQEDALMGNITAAIPGFGALVEEDEAGQEATAAGMELTEALGGVLQAGSPAAAAAAPPPAGSPDLLDMFAPSPAPSAPVPAAAAAPPSAEREAPASSSGVPPSGQVNKWGFVPGDDDTMEMDMMQNGRNLMGDRTYAHVYADTTAGGSELGAGRDDPTSDSLLSGGPAPPAASPPQGQEQAGPQAEGLPNWTAPAFMPPYMQAGNHEEDHPALRQSPNVTNSSMGTLDTRRTSVDARRQSVTSRRGSLAQPDGTGGLLLASAGGSASKRRRSGRLSDVTDNLLDDDEEEVGEAGGGDMLAGLKKQMRLLSQGSPAPAGHVSPAAAAAFATMEQGLSGIEEMDVDLDAEAEAEAEAEAGGEFDGSDDGEAADGLGAMPPPAAKTPHTAAFSMGYAGSSHNPRTAALLKTGGTTGLLLADTTQGGRGPATGGGGGGTTHGTTALLRMDETGSGSVVGAQLLAQQQGGPEGHYQAGAGVGVRMAHSPPLSALSAGSRGRRHSMPAGLPPRPSPAGPAHSVHSARSMSVLGATPGGGGGGVPANAVAAASALGPAPPGSAIAARYPGSAAATGRLSMGLTPSNAPPITFGDFAKLVDVAFLDNLRRGASINYADLQPNAAPAGLADSYRLLCVTSPNVAELEVAIHTLQSEAARLRGSAADLEVLLGQANPPLFRHVQAASAEQLDGFRAGAALLKRVCRQKAAALLKDVRCQMEESKALRLARAAEGLRADLAYVAQHAQHMDGVGRAAGQYVAAARERLAEEAGARVGEAERRQRLAAARAALAEAEAANAERRGRLEAAAGRAAAAREERAALAAERAAAQDEAEALSGRLAALRGPDGRAYDGAPQAVLRKLEEVARLQACLGWQLESAGEGAASADACLRLGELFRLRLAAGPDGVRGAAELVNPGALPPAQRALAAAAASAAAFLVAPAAAAAAVQAAAARLHRAADLWAELAGARLAFAPLAEVGPAPGGGLRLVFVNLEAEVRFGVTLALGGAAPGGDCAEAAPEVRVWFDGEGQVTARAVAEAVAGVPRGPGRVRAVCAALSALAAGAAPRQGLPAGAAAFHTSFGNPLFGGGGDARVPTQA